MKVRCVNNNWNNLTKGKVYDVIYIIDSEIQIYNDSGNKQTFYIGNFEVIKEENKMQEKTFREVIADIKEGEVWECRSKYIKRFADGIQIYHKEKGKATPSMLMANNDKFKLQRKEVTFAEAFKAYEQGKGIESVVSNVQYQKELKDTVSIRPCYGEWFDANEKTLVFDYVEIKGKWYINN